MTLDPFQGKQERLCAGFTAHEAHVPCQSHLQYAQHVREVFYQDTSAQGRLHAKQLTERLPSCTIPEIASLGQTLRM